MSKSLDDKTYTEQELRKICHAVARKAISDFCGPFTTNQYAVVKAHLDNELGGKQ